MTRLIFVTLSIACTAGIASPASAQRTRVSPYIEASQVVAADLNGGDVLTYSTVAVGVDASVHTRRIEVQGSYKYERRFDYQKPLSKDDMHSGLVRAKAALAPGFSIEAGGIATRTRSDNRGDALLTSQGNTRNSAQVYSAYVGPNLASRIGPLFANAAYRFGYTKVEAPGATGVAPGQPRLDAYDDSTVHVATASLGVKSGTVLPIGVTASASYTREDAGQLDQRYEGKFGRVDAVLPIARGFAIGGGIGYEKIQIRQRDAVRDAANNPVVDANGRFVTNPASPRRLAYNIDGMFWDAGVIWKPSRRTFLEARVGRRYNSMSYTGSLSFQPSPGSGAQIGVYDSVQTFGQQLNGSLSALPTSFVTTTDPFGNQYGGCVYGTVGSAAGGCLNNVFSSAATSAYRSRGATAVAVSRIGRSRVGMGFGYARRDFIAPTGTPGFTVNGVSDQSLYGNVFASTEMGRNGSLSGSAFGSYATTDIPGNDGVIGWGANTAYTHRFGPLGATLSAGVFGFENQSNGSSAAAQALLGLRYGF
ncbi:hypothetical protein [Sphingomonas sp.]|uniref:hypothetical protein n=1 Tax=Sphingomonas sp. TaxID=28214 RepID=UPI002EDA643B